MRNPARLTQTHKNLRVYTGNILDEASIASAVHGQDAVLCALGAKNIQRNTILSEGTKNIVMAMTTAHVTRLIFMSALGVGDSFMHAPLITKLAGVTLLKNIFADKVLQEKYIRESNLDWTILHPVTLTPSNRITNYRSGITLSVTSFSTISRGSVADFMLKQISDKVYVHNSIIISS